MTRSVKRNEENCFKIIKQEESGEEGREEREVNNKSKKERENLR